MNHILQLDTSGLPEQWLSREDAVLLYTKDRVRWELGDNHIVMRGGINRSGLRSSLSLAPVVAVSGGRKSGLRKIPLANPVLFRRDNYMCLYCGQQFRPALLTRDHIVPRVQGGKDRWTNVVTACQRCNHHKGGRTPEQAGMKLLAIPFEPNIFEFMYLSNRKILGDQMEYLCSRFSGKRIWQAA